MFLPNPKSRLTGDLGFSGKSMTKSMLYLQTPPKPYTITYGTTLSLPEFCFCRESASQLTM